MTGFRTFLIGLAMVIIPPVTQYIGAIDWSTILPPPYSWMVSGVMMVIMRLLTSTPVFTKRK